MSDKFFGWGFMMKISRIVLLLFVNMLWFNLAHGADEEIACSAVCPSLCAEAECEELELAWVGGACRVQVCDSGNLAECTDEESCTDVDAVWDTSVNPAICIAPDLGAAISYNSFADRALSQCLLKTGKFWFNSVTELHCPSYKYIDYCVAGQPEYTISSLVGLDNLVSLEFLNLNDNQIDLVSEVNIKPIRDLAALTLRKLNIYGNTNVDGEYAGIDGIANLTYLDLGGMNISSIGNALNSLSGTITTLVLKNNNLGNEVVAKVKDCSNLIYLHLADNNLSGSHDFSSLLNLRYLNVAGNPDLSCDVKAVEGCTLIKPAHCN